MERKLTHVINEATVHRIIIKSWDPVTMGENIYKFVISMVPGDWLVPLDAKPSVATAMTMFAHLNVYV